MISFTAWLGNLCGVSEKEADAHRGLRHLRRLGLASTPLTDGDLGHLAELKILEELDLEGTRTTFEGRKKLREALPNCRIIDQRPAVRLSDPRR